MPPLSQFAPEKISLATITTQFGTVDFTQNSDTALVTWSLKESRSDLNTPIISLESELGGHPDSPIRLMITALAHYLESPSTAPLEFSGLIPPEIFKEHTDLSRLSDLERAVLHTMSAIPAGTLISYSDLARKAGYPGAARAVGSVCAKNPYPLLYPCHRVGTVNDAATWVSNGASEDEHPDKNRIPVDYSPIIPKTKYQGGAQWKEFLLRAESQSTLRS